MPNAGDEIIGRIWADIQRMDRKRASAAVLADPLAHKTTRLFEGGVDPENYRFYRVKGRGRETRYCYSVKPNLAGFYLGWIEVETKTKLKRTSFTARRVKARLMELAERRSKAHKARLAK